MESKAETISWDELRSQLMDNVRMQDLLAHLKNQQHVNSEEILLLSLFMQEAASKEAAKLALESKEISENYAKETISVSQATSEFTRRLKNATYWLAAATIILALSAVIEIAIRLICER